MIFEEAKKVCITILVISAIFLVFSIFFGFFGYDVIIGIVYGTIYTLINFSLLGVAVQNAILRNPRSAKIYIQTQYAIRFAFAALALTIAILSPYINYIIVFLCMLSPKITYFSIGIYSLINKRRK